MFDKIAKLLARNPIDADLDEIVVSEIRKTFCAFKLNRSVSWSVILPIVHAMSVGILIEARGTSAARNMLAKRSIQKHLSDDIASESIASSRFTTPSWKEYENIVETVLSITKHLLLRRHKIETITEALSSFSLSTASTFGDPLFASMVYAHALDSFDEHSASRAG